MRSPAPGRTAPRASLGALLAGSLLLAALLPEGDAPGPLAVRLAAAALVALRWTDAVVPASWRGGLPRLLAIGSVVFCACGFGFWWLEPKARTLGDGLWLAFTTAATVGYGDIVPSTPASRIFAVFVVLLGVAVLSLVTASIAAVFVQTEERRIEREMLRDLHREIARLHGELASLRHEMRPAADRATR